MSNLRVRDLMTPDVHAVHPDDPILMETHGRRGFNRLLPGSVAETVLREAPCLVLVVPPGAHPATSEAVTFKRIFWPIDFSPSALQALGFELGRPASRRARHAIARSRVVGGRGAAGIALDSRRDGARLCSHCFGSTTSQVVRGARCPVLTVRGPRPM